MFFGQKICSSPPINMHTKTPREDKYPEQQDRTALCTITMNNIGHNFDQKSHYHGSQIIKFIITIIVSKKDIHHRLIQLLGRVVIIVFVPSPIPKMGGKASEMYFLSQMFLQKPSWADF